MTRSRSRSRSKQSLESKKISRDKKRLERLIKKQEIEKLYEFAKKDGSYANIVSKRVNNYLNSLPKRVKYEDPYNMTLSERDIKWLNKFLELYD